MGFRKVFIKQLKHLIEGDENILAAWEGGSAATGYLDQYSDLDLGLVCRDEKVEYCFQLIENMLEEKLGIKSSYRVPEPSWHGHSQCYYFLDNTPPLFFFDLLVEKESAGNRFVESDRHGNAVIWFDKKDLLDTSPTPEEEIRTRIINALKRMQGYFPVLITDLRKLIKRGKIIDSVYVYHQLVNRLGYLLNMKYRPPRYDFGLRYTDRDYPGEEIRQLEKWMLVDNLEDISLNVDLIEQKCSELLSELNRKYPGTG